MKTITDLLVLDKVVRNLAVQGAYFLVGVTEQGGPNRGPMVDALAVEAGYPPGSQWCSVFVVAMWKRAMRSVSVSTQSKLTLMNKSSRGAVKLFHKNNAIGLAETYKTWEPKKGDAFVRVRDEDDRDKAVAGSSFPGHAGIVVGYNPETRMITTIEGNTIFKGEDANGGGIFKKSISLDDPRLVGGVIMNVELI